MNVRELQDIIREGGWWGHNIDGCRLLECIKDMSGFVSLLRKFHRNGNVNIRFEDYYPYPIETILNMDVMFRVFPDRTCISINGGVFIMEHNNEC